MEETTLSTAEKPATSVVTAEDDPAIMNNSIGFNGERRDPITGLYHLGNGYRAYNPTLMRFHAPDRLSPFGGGGINPYAYCLGDPINFTDPTGHFSAGADLGLNIFAFLMGAAALVLAVPTGGASLGVAAATAASSVAIGSTMLGMASAVAGITADSIAINDQITGRDRSETIYAFGIVSGVLGVLSIVTGVVQPSVKPAMDWKKGLGNKKLLESKRYDPMKTRRAYYSEIVEQIDEQKSLIKSARSALKPKAQLKAVFNGTTGFDSQIFKKMLGTPIGSKTPKISNAKRGFWGLYGTALVANQAGGYALFANTDWNPNALSEEQNDLSKKQRELRSSVFG